MRLYRFYSFVPVILALLSLAACSNSTSVTTPLPSVSLTEEQPENSEPIGATETPITDATTASGAVQVYNIVAEESEAAYEVGEVFFNQNNRFNLAIGVTHAISGSVTIDAANPQNSAISTITIDISQFQSDESRRDERIRREWLESATYPIATFVPTSIEGLPESYVPGEAIVFRVTGDLTIRDVTNPVTFEVTAKLDGDTLTGTAASMILMTDFGFSPPTIAGMLEAENEVTMRLTFVARP